MRPGRPKQHTHNWSLALSGWSKFSPLPEEYKDYDSPGGFHVNRYWKCVRGGKVKHTFVPPKLDKRVFIMASGMHYSAQQRVD